MPIYTKEMHSPVTLPRLTETATEEAVCPSIIAEFKKQCGVRDVDGFDLTGQWVASARPLVCRRRRRAYWKSGQEVVSRRGCGGRRWPECGVDREEAGRRRPVGCRGLCGGGGGSGVEVVFV